MILYLGEGTTRESTVVRHYWRELLSLKNGKIYKLGEIETIQRFEKSMARLKKNNGSYSVAVVQPEVKIFTEKDSTEVGSFKSEGWKKTVISSADGTTPFAIRWQRAYRFELENDGKKLGEGTA